MRSSRNIAAVLVLMVLTPARPYSQSFYNPRNPVDLPLPGDPPDVFTDPFDPSGLPDPVLLPDPWEDPLDPPEPDFPLPDPPDFFDPLPDVPSLFPDPFDEIPTPPAPSSRSVGARLRLPPRAATNVVTSLMAFPMRLPFPPSYSGMSAAPRQRVCNPLNASQIVAVESNKNTVAFVNTCPWQVVAHVAVGKAPVGVKTTPDGSEVLVANAGDGNTSGSVSVITTSNRAIAKTIPFPATSPDGSLVVPNGITFLPDGSRAYVSSHSCNPGSFVYTIDMSSLTITGAPIPVACFPSSIAVTPDGSQLWVSERGASRLDVYDTATGANVSAFNVQRATGVRFNPTGTTAYIGEGISPGNLVVIDTATYTVTARIPVGNLPYVVAVTPTGRHVFVTNGLSNSISMISTATNQVVRTINLPTRVHDPVGLVFIQ